MLRRIPPTPLLLALFGIILAIAVPLARLTAPSTIVLATPIPEVAPPHLTYSLLGQPATGHLLFEQRCNPTSVVHSDYSGEVNLLDYSTPVDDIDYENGYGVQCQVTLPGYASDHYVYLGSVYVDGSGWVTKFLTPNGGHFAFLHIGVVYLSTVGMPRFYPQPSRIGMPTAIRGDGDDATAQVVGSVSTMPKGAPTAGYVPGGTVVGVSQWPLWALFGNGVAGPANAHLCFLLDARAADWFFSIAAGQHHPPKPTPKFNQKAWDAYRVGHHESRITAYDGHHHLRFAAVLWWHGHVKTAGGIAKKESWHPKGKGGVDGFEQDVFAKQQLVFWPRHSAWKPRWSKG